MNCLTNEHNTKNHTKTIFASSEHLLSFCMEMRDSKKKHPKFSTFSWTMWRGGSIKVSGCSHDLYSESGGEIATQHFSLRHWLRGWRADWRTSTKKHSKVWKERQTFTLQQSYLLRQRHELLLQIFSMQHMWCSLLKDWKFGAAFDYM